MALWRLPNGMVERCYVGAKETRGVGVCSEWCKWRKWCEMKQEVAKRLERDAGAWPVSSLVRRGVRRGLGMAMARQWQVDSSKIEGDEMVFWMSGESKHASSRRRRDGKCKLEIRA